MACKKNRKIIYVLLFIAVLVINALLIIIFRDRAAITKYSIPSIVFAFCSAVYAIVAISLRENFNLFFLNLFIIAKIFNKSYNKTQEYKEDFIKFAFVYCSTIPIYITLSLFADNFYSGIMWPIDLSIIRDVVIILLGLIPPVIKNIVKKSNKTLRMKWIKKSKKAVNRWENGNNNIIRQGTVLCL